MLVALGVVTDLAIAAIVIGGDFTGGEGLAPEAEFINIAVGAAFTDKGDSRRIQIQRGKSGNRGNDGAIDIQCRRVGIVVTAQPCQSNVVPDVVIQWISFDGIHRGVFRQRGGSWNGTSIESRANHTILNVNAVPVLATNEAEQGTIGV